MAFVRKWKQPVVEWRDIASECQSITDRGWNVHTIMPTTDIEPRRKEEVLVDGAIIVAYFDEPDLSGGVPR